MTLKALAKSLAVVMVFGTAAQAHEDLQSSDPEAASSDVADTMLNGCIEEILRNEKGVFKSSRLTKEGRITENFTVNASPAADKGHIIGTVVTLHGTTNGGMTDMKISGIYQPAAGNDHGESLIDFAITPDMKDFSKPVRSALVTRDMPKVNIEPLKANTFRILEGIAVCMRFVI
jgi:hypothetical protein